MRDNGLGGLQNEVRLDIAARAENVALARSLVASLIAGYWDITLSALEEVKVAVSEAVSNAIIHGYRSDAGRFVHMRLLQHERALVVEISDEGVGIADIKRAMEPDYSTEVEHLGLGFAFMNTFMDKVEVASAPGQGATVRLIRLMPPVEQRV